MNQPSDSAQAAERRRELVISSCRHRQDQIKKKLVQVRLRKNKCEESEKARWQKIERQLLLSYHQEEQRILRLERGEGQAPARIEKPSQPALSPPSASSTPAPTSVQEAAEIDGWVAREREMSAELEQSRLAHEELSLQFAQTRHQLAETQARLKQAELSVTEAQASRSQELSVWKEREETLVRLEVEVADMRVELQSVLNTLGQREQTIAELRQQLREKDREVSDLRHETEELLNEIAHNHQDFHTDNKEFQLAREQWAAQEMAQRAEIEQLRRRLDASSAEPGVGDNPDGLEDLELALPDEDLAGVDFSSIEVENPPDWLLTPVEEERTELA